jgi:hypothetical protein
VKTIFKGDAIGCYVCVSVPADPDVMKTIVGLSVGTVVKVKCRFEFSEKRSLLSLTAEEVDEISNVKLVVD